MTTPRILPAAAITAMLTVLAGAAPATVIDFGGLTGTNGQAFGFYQEDGFNITDSSDTWQKAFGFGNPVPAIYTALAGVNTISITLNEGDQFSFASADIGCGVGGDGDCQLRAEGSLGGTSVFDFSSGTFAADGTWHTISSAFSSPIDTLVLTQYANDSNIDNINLTLSTVPLPATGLMLITGLGGLAALRRRRKS